MADIKKIDIVLNKFLVEQGLADSLCACYIEDCDSYYQYDSVLSRVVLGGLTNKKADEIYMDYCRELGLEVDVDVMTMSFLHEIGHHNTIDFLDGEEIFESEMIKLLLAANNEETKEYFKHVIKECKEFNIDYQSLLPTEVQRFYDLNPVQQNAISCDKAEANILNIVLQEIVKLYNIYQRAPQAKREIHDIKNIIEDCKKYNIDYKKVLTPEMLKFFGVE